MSRANASLFLLFTAANGRASVPPLSISASIATHSGSAQPTHGSRAILATAAVTSLNRKLVR
jgi:hypothetical protein